MPAHKPNPSIREGNWAAAICGCSILVLSLVFSMWRHDVSWLMVFILLMGGMLIGWIAGFGFGADGVLSPQPRAWIRIVLGGIMAVVGMVYFATGPTTPSWHYIAGFEWGILTGGYFITWNGLQLVNYLRRRFGSRQRSDPVVHDKQPDKPSDDWTLEELRAYYDRRPLQDLPPNHPDHIR